MASTRYDVAIVGAGAAGMMAAVGAAREGASVVLLERMPRTGRKILVTGKGRCNLTNAKPWPEFAPHIHNDSQFFRKAFYGFSNQDLISFFEENGMKSVVTRGDRVYPETMSAMTVGDTLLSAVKSSGVELMTDAEVSAVTTAEGGFALEVGHRGGTRQVSASTVILATGGLSYPATGSTGIGHAIAAELGHTVTRCHPSLVALMPKNYDSRLQGIDLENVAVSLYLDKDLVRTEAGDLSFTEDGIEGPIGFRVSRQAVRAMENGQSVSLVLDLKPALSESQLKSRIERETNLGWGTAVTFGLLMKLMPRALVASFMDANPDLTLRNLPERLKRWPFRIVSNAGYRRAVVTAGGVSLKEVVSKSMESKLVPGLFFAGELVDLDGDTGGYNLQIAFSTGMLAGRSAAVKAKKS